MNELRSPPNLTVANRLLAEPHHIRKHVTAILDEMSAPMTSRQIEGALIESGGWTRAERKRIVKALKVLPIIAMGAG